MHQRVYCIQCLWGLERGMDAPNPGGGCKPLKDLAHPGEMLRLHQDRSEAKHSTWVMPPGLDFQDSSGKKTGRQGGEGQMEIVPRRLVEDGLGERGGLGRRGGGDSPEDDVESRGNVGHDEGRSAARRRLNSRAALRLELMLRANSPSRV